MAMDSSSLLGRIIVVSPHLDDAILSCYPMIRDWLAEGDVVELWTVMAGLPEADGLFPKYAMELASNHPLGYVQARQKEDLDVATELNIKAVHFSFLDAPFRADRVGVSIYPELHSLFNRVDLRELHLVNKIADALQQQLRSEDTLVAPSSICGHVDHILTRVACETLPNKILFYDEFPYTIRAGQPVCSDVQVEWARLIRAYKSQMRFLFPGDSLNCLTSVHHPQLMALPRIAPRIPRVVHFVWVGDAPMPPAARNNIDKWKSQLGQGWQVRLWGNADLTERTFDSVVLDTIDKAPHGIQKADILRYHIMSTMGGWYLDLDFEPIQSIEPIALLLHCEELILCNEEDHLVGKLSNGFFACIPGHPAIAKLAEVVLTQPLNTGAFNMAHIVSHTGPVLFNAILKGANGVLLPRELFYPVAFSEIWSNRPVDLGASFAEHVWNHRYKENKQLYFNGDDSLVELLRRSRRGKCDNMVMAFCFVKDEPYLISRWMPYHARLFGLENIMVIDHGSSNETASLLKIYAEHGLQLYDAGHYSFAEKSQILSRVMRRFRSYRFLVPFDSDEFLCLKSDAGMDCDGDSIKKVFEDLADEPVVFKFGTFDVCNVPCGSYEDSLEEMTRFQFFPPEADAVFSTSAPAKSFYPGKHFLSTDSGNHTGRVEPDHGVLSTRLALAHFHTRGYQHFLAKHAQAGQALGVDNMEEYILNKGICYHWIERNLAIRNGEARNYFDSVLCSLPGREEKAFSNALTELRQEGLVLTE